MASRNNNFIKGGYWLAQQANILPPQLIPASNFTHLFYGFAAIDSTTYRLYISPRDEVWIPIFIDTIRNGNQQAKAFLSIGGPKPSHGTDPSTVISEMARNPETRADFISSTIDVAQKYEFDGFDLAWEFPKTSEDMHNMGYLLKEWYQQIKDLKPKLFLTARVYFSPAIKKSIKYPTVALSDYLHFLNVIPYDYGPCTCVRGQVKALECKNTDAGIRSWLHDSIPPNKLVLGIPLYGNKFTLADEDDNGIGAPVVSYDGVVAYRDIPGGNNGTYDDPTKSEYVSHGTSWFGYDGPKSIPRKIEYARTNYPIGGYFLYSLGDDDDQYTLSNAAFNA